MYIGGGAGALALTGVAAASAYYLTNRPTPERPLFPLDAQCLLVPEEDVSVNVFLPVTQANDGNFFLLKTPY